MRFLTTIYRALFVLSLAHCAYSDGLLEAVEAAAADVDIYARRILGLPSNVQSDFWDSDKPPSASSDQSQALRFEILHCDRGFE